MNQQIDKGHEDWPTDYCNWHPSVETRLSCGRCGKATCTQCLVQAPVGIRCAECAKATKIPTFDVPPTAYAKAAAIGALLAIGGGALWAVVNLIFISLGLVVFASVALPGLVVGYAAGELINGAVNAKRSKGLAYIAAGSVVAAFIFGQILYSGRVGFVGLAVLAVSIYMAVQRVK